MPVYVDREAPKLWRRICSETTLEASLLAEKWKLVLAGLAFQYLHGLAAHGVHYLHRPGPTLQDAGFFILPALGEDKAFLPGPNYHCREGSKLAKIPPPKNALDELKLPEMAERSSSGPSQTPPLLPLSTKDGKNKSKEDHQRLPNENNIADEH